jgi:L-ascorbate metabolism protein UlaG (beta-lactamase superfamily)
MDALRAAQALRLIRPRIAIPIHWGTFVPVGMHLRHWSYLAQPPLEFRRYARDLAPDVEVRVLQPGESFALREHPRHAPLAPLASLAGPSESEGSRPRPAAEKTEPA